MTIPNFCINFLNKAAKLLPILYDFAVASLAGAWIKISSRLPRGLFSTSHPSRVRGLKWKKGTLHNEEREVASLADAWIKI